MNGEYQFLNVLNNTYSIGSSDNIAHKNWSF